MRAKYIQLGVREQNHANLGKTRALQEHPRFSADLNLMSVLSCHGADRPGVMVTSQHPHAGSHPRVHGTVPRPLLAFL